eukprot:TRINITY_DN102867_c0_g1_i1.p1 TRINITY_DN102867_c0_g1~~TRINITY_DN102867_c0_g1_i1.p1  ORF type:complete len:158 (-),score=24.44 TRINITY_DN102867_c0_g1_i1:28-501(-)
MAGINYPLVVQLKAAQSSERAAYSRSSLGSSGSRSELQSPSAGLAASSAASGLSFRGDCKPMALLETLPQHQHDILDHYVSNMSRRSPSSKSQENFISGSPGSMPLGSSLTLWQSGKSVDGQVMVQRPTVYHGTMKPAGHILNLPSIHHSRGQNYQN